MFLIHKNISSSQAKSEESELNIYTTMRFWNKYTVLETVLEAAGQKMHAVPYLNRSPLNIGYGFSFFDWFNAPYISKHC